MSVTGVQFLRVCILKKEGKNYAFKFLVSYYLHG